MVKEFQQVCVEFISKMVKKCFFGRRKILLQEALFLYQVTSAVRGMRVEQFTVGTTSRCELVQITAQIRAVVRNAGVESGVCVVYCPHTTAGLTINENADPDVVRDMVYQLQKLVPADDPGYKHLEGNSAAHILASLLGSSAHLIIENGDLKLGTWQGVFLAEFDGPRTRKVWVQIVGR